MSPGARSQEPGARSQEPGARSQEPGARSQDGKASHRGLAKVGIRESRLAGSVIAFCNFSETAPIVLVVLGPTMSASQIFTRDPPWGAPESWLLAPESFPQ
jgi:hypothetical protein